MCQKAKERERVLFASLVGACCVVRAVAGELIIIPGGWIHAVYTQADSVAVGGNFLHGFNVPMQIACHTMELSDGPSPEFLFPGFHELHIKALAFYKERLESLNWQEFPISFVMSMRMSWITEQPPASTTIYKTCWIRLRI